MSVEMLALLGLLVGVIAFLLSLLMTPGVRSSRRHTEDVRGYCPLCGHDLRKGERVRSNQFQVGDRELRTFIRGCPFCLEGKGRKRQCPVCGKRLEGEESVVAFSDPQEDRKRLSIRGCKKCYPRAYDGVPYN